MINIKLVIILLLISFKAIAQITLIPDSSFEHYLVNQGIDTDGLVNGQVLTSDISDETELHLFFLQAEDLTGIEDFASLEVLFLEVMDITSLDISQNSNLKRLSIDGLNLVSLDVSQNLELERIFLSFGMDPTLNQITHIDVSNNLLLRKLSIYHGEISSLDVSNNALMETIELSSMDNLETVNLKNGNNDSIFFLRFQNDAALQCVQVDDPAAVIAGMAPPYDNWIIESALITDDCQLGLEEDLLDLFTVYPNPVKETLHIKSNGVEITKLSIYDMLGRLVLEKSTEFENLDVSMLQRGWFILKLETEFGVRIKKLLME